MMTMMGMMKEEEERGWGPRVCDTCRSAASGVYCRTESSFMCAGCDARVHRGAWGHERVRVCEACERAPSALVCKADAASLCAPCDSAVHSANPLARRHHRIPVSPLPPPPDNNDNDDVAHHEAATWLLPPPKEVDEYLDLVDYQDDHLQPSIAKQSTAGDSVVPCDDETSNNNNNNIDIDIDMNMNLNVMMMSGDGDINDHYHHHHHYHHRRHEDEDEEEDERRVFHMGFDLGFDDHSKIGYGGYHNNNAASITTQSPTTVSVSSLDVSVVPDSAMSEISMTTHSRPAKGTIDLFSGPPVPQIPTQLNPMDREARVLRYREKKKNRKFEKTIRYASRKAYAETRPRIKGRFAKRTDNEEVDVDQMFSTALITDTSSSGYGIVPSF